MINQPSLEDDARTKDMAQAAALVGKACKIVDRHNTGHSTIKYLAWSMRQDLGFLTTLAGRGRYPQRPRPRRQRTRSNT